jgi:hypothetical protein
VPVRNFTTAVNAVPEPSASFTRTPHESSSAHEARVSIARPYVPRREYSYLTRYCCTCALKSYPNAMHGTQRGDRIEYLAKIAGGIFSRDRFEERKSRPLSRIGSRSQTSGFIVVFRRRILSHSTIVSDDHLDFHSAFEVGIQNFLSLPASVSDAFPTPSSLGGIIKCDLI